MDFADETDSSLLEQAVLTQYPHLFVMKSISKSYGVPGIRLGILAGDNKEMIAKLKRMSLYGILIPLENSIFRSTKNMPKIIKQLWISSDRKEELS